jgi:hypothetical protein
MRRRSTSILDFIAEFLLESLNEVVEGWRSASNLNEYIRCEHKVKAGYTPKQVPNISKATIFFAMLKCCL